MEACLSDRPQSMYFELRNPLTQQFDTIVKAPFRSAVTSMTTTKLYTGIEQNVTFFYNQLQLSKHEKTTGRPLALSIIEIITLAILKQVSGIATKVALWKSTEPKCSYKTLSENFNHFAPLALLIVKAICAFNRQCADKIKLTDSTDIPVCLNKNANQNRVMKGLAVWGHSGKGLYFGLKLHMTTDSERKILSFSLTPANKDDRSQFQNLNSDLAGVFLADAGYVSEELRSSFYKENEKILFTAVRKNMKKLITDWQYHLYNLRMRIELNFRSLKQFFGLVTSIPRSPKSMIANYVYSLLAYCLAG